MSATTTAIEGGGNGRVCAVFGYGLGLGSSIARKWSMEGWRVAILARTLDGVRKGEDDIPNCKGYRCDVTDPESITSTVSSIEKDLGPIDCLVYNAGSDGTWKTWDQIAVDDFEREYQTNVSGLLKASQSIIPGMIERGRGTVLITTLSSTERSGMMESTIPPHWIPMPWQIPTGTWPINRTRAGHSKRRSRGRYRSTARRRGSPGGRKNPTHHHRPTKGSD